MTNKFQTFAIFTYKCGDIQWSGLNQNQAAVVGFNAEGDYFENHPLSGFASIGEAVSCTFDVSERQKRNVDPGFQTDLNVISLGPDNPITVIVYGCECDAMYSDDRDLFQDIFSDEPNIDGVPGILVERFESCPPTEQQAMNDLGRYIKQPSDSISISDVECYVSGRPIEIESLEITQQCCYSQVSG